MEASSPAGPSGRCDRSRIETLGLLWGMWRDHGQRLPAAAWARPSGVGRWTVKELYGHVARGIGVLEGMLPGSEPGRGDTVDFPTAASYFLNFRSWQGEASAVSERAAVEYAAGHSPADMVREFTRAPAVLDALGERMDWTLPTPFGTVTGAAYLVTRIVEATVHLVDLQRAVGWPVEVSDRASAVTARLLLELCPRQRFIDAATGRGEPDFFPVLT